MSIKIGLPTNWGLIFPGNMGGNDDNGKKEKKKVMTVNSLK